MNTDIVAVPLISNFSIYLTINNLKMLNLLLFTLLVTNATLTVSTIPVSGFPPSERMYHSSLYSSYFNSIIIFGGKDGSTLNNEVWAYNFTTTSWNLLYPLKDLSPGNSYSEVRHSSAIYISSLNPLLLYIFGGIGSYGPLSDLWSFNLVTRIWKNEKTFKDFFPLVSFAYDFYTWSNSEYLCIFGGVDIYGYSSALHM